MKRLSIVLLVFVLLSISCSGQAATPDAGTVQTAIAQTQSASLPTATKPPSPTNTPRPTKTVTPTRTPTNTPTNTPLAGTQTKVSAILTAAQDKRNITATASKKAANTTSTARAVSAYKTKIADYAQIDIREFLTYPKNHVGEKVVVTGRVFNVAKNGGVLQIYVSGYEAVYVEMDQPVSGIYEDDTVTVYGVIYGIYCFENTLGNEICQPALYNAFLAE